MGEWQLLAILLHWTAVISAAAEILSHFHVEISVSVCMCDHWFDTMCVGEEVIQQYSQFTIIHGWVLPQNHAVGDERSRPEPPKS